jgi:hypothetical protein
MEIAEKVVQDLLRLSLDGRECKRGCSQLEYRLTRIISVVYNGEYCKLGFFNRYVTLPNIVILDSGLGPEEESQGGEFHDCVV